MAAPDHFRLPLLRPLSPSAATAAGEMGESGETEPAVPSGKRFFLETWGCQMNVYDSERFSGQLRGLGYLPASDVGEADLILLNTCSVREQAEEKLFSRLGRLKELKRERPDLVIGVAGCVAQQEQDRILRRAPIVDFVVGTRAVSGLGRLVADAVRGQRTVDVALRDDRYDEVRVVDRVGFRAYVTVVEGCNKSCSFCIVPFTRGPEVNRPPEAVLAEARSAIEGGAVEVELLGQNVNAYQHGDIDFAGLLRMVDRLPGLRRLRFATSHPRELSDGVIAAMADCETVCNHLHLPVQSGSTTVLKRMFRGYDRARYLSRVRKLRTRVPGISLSTDIIVGFPGETEEEFADTLSLIDEVEFDQVFAFVYSPRPGTRAETFDDPVGRPEKEERLQRLFARQDEISRRLNAAMVDRTVEVLVEGPSKRDPAVLQGRTRDNRVVNLAGATGSRLGQLVNVKVTRSFPHSLYGERVASVNAGH